MSVPMDGDMAFRILIGFIILVVGGYGIYVLRLLNRTGRM